MDLHPYPYAKTRTTAGHATPERNSNTMDLHHVNNIEVLEEVDLNGAMIELSDLRLLLSTLLSSRSIA